MRGRGQPTQTGSGIEELNTFVVGLVRRLPSDPTADQHLGFDFLNILCQSNVGIFYLHANKLLFRRQRHRYSYHFLIVQVRAGLLLPAYEFVIRHVAELSCPNGTKATGLYLSFNAVYLCERSAK